MRQLNEKENTLKGVCEWLQRNDKNGEYDLLFKDYLDGEIALESVQECCLRVLNEWLNYEIDPTDEKEKALLNKIIDSIK